MFKTLPTEGLPGVFNVEEETLQLSLACAEGFSSQLWSSWCLPVLARNPQVTECTVGYAVTCYSIIYIYIYMYHTQAAEPQWLYHLDLVCKPYK